MTQAADSGASTAPSKPSDQVPGLGDSVRTGLALTGGTYMIRQATELLTSIVLARLLLPQDFGIVAVVGSFLQLSYVVGNLGMSIAVIQARTLSRADCDAAFTLSTTAGVGLTLLALIISPWTARFFAMPILDVAMPIMALQVLLAGLSATPVAILRRELRFGQVAIVDGASTVSYAVTSIGLAAGGYGIWSLVWSPLVSGMWTLLAALVFTRYSPRLGFERDSIRRLLGYGSTLTFKNVFVQLGRNSDNLVVAKLLGATATGLYTRAFNFSTMPQTRLVAVLYSICFPAFCRLRDDQPRFHDWYVKATAGVAVVVFPILLGLGVLAEEFTLAVLGRQWLDMVPSFRLLCMAGLLNSLHMLGSAAIEASGRLRYEVATESVHALLIPAGSILGARYGIEGVSSAVLGAAAMMYLMKGYTLRAAIGLPIRRYATAPLPAALSAIVMSAAVLGALQILPLRTGSSDSATAWMRLAVGAGVGFVVYGCVLRVIGAAQFKMIVEQLQQLLAQWRRRTLPPSAVET